MAKAKAALAEKKARLEELKKERAALSGLAPGSAAGQPSAAALAATANPLAPGVPALPGAGLSAAELAARAAKAVEIASR